MVTIKTADTNREIAKFMKFPIKFYKDNPYYVPDILSDQIADMRRDKNPAFAYCDAKCFLAYRDGKIVGRIAAILNNKANEKFQKKYLNFAHVDFIDDDEVVDALFGAVEDWARELGCVAVHGPLGFSDMDREGMLIEGFDRMSLFYTYYNYPYYKRQLERLGYDKEVDWIEMRVKVPEELHPRLERIAKYVMERMNLHTIQLGDKPLREIVEGMFRVYNEAYTALFGAVPVTDEQVKKYVSKFRPLLNKRMTTFVYNDKDEMVAFGIACPSLSKAQRKSKGRLLPFGWARILYALNGRNDTVNMLLIGVKPELQGGGINGAILSEFHHKLIKAKVKFAESGPMLADNTRVINPWLMFDTEQHKRRRCFVKELSSQEPA